MIACRCRLLPQRVLCLLTAKASTGDKSAAAKVVPQKKDERLEFEMDTEMLTKYACINYLKEGKHPELKTDSEYPDWLWKLNIGDSKDVEELEVDSWEYWRKVRRLYLKESAKLGRLKYRSAYLHRHY